MKKFLRGYIQRLKTLWPRSAVTVGLAALAVGLVGIFRWVERQQDLDARMPEFIGLLLLAGILYVIGVFWIERFRLGPTALLIILAGAVVLILLLAAMKQSLHRVLAYAWNPAVLISFAMSGHFDSLAIVTFLGALFFLVTNRPALSMAGLALSFLSKFFPVLLLQFSSNVVARVRSCLPLAGLLLLGRAQDEAISGRRRLGFRPLVCNAILPNEHSRCSRGVGLERKISMTSQGKCATYFSV